MDGPLEVGLLGDDRRPEQLMVGRGDGAGAFGVGRRPGLERPALDQQAEDTGELANAIFEYLEILHNRQRRHSALGWRTAVEFEKLHATDVG